MFRRYINPIVGTLPVSEVTSSDVVRLLTLVQSQYPRLVPRVRQHVDFVLKWAVAHGLRTDNPAAPDALGGVLRPPLVAVPYRALPHADVAAALARVRVCDAWIGTRLLLEAQVLTVVRPGEARGALWPEFDMDRARWAIPAGRTRDGREHDVPLSTRALALLEEARASEELRAARARGGCPERVFPSPRGRALGSHASLRLLSDLDVAAAPYGFRHSFREWCADTDVESAVAARCLAHLDKRVTAAVCRNSLFTRRTTVLQRWGQYCTRPEEDEIARSSPGRTRPHGSRVLHPAQAVRAPGDCAPTGALR